MWFHTKSVVLTSGHSTGGTPINAFDNALRRAGIADFNLIKVSSIVPPGVPVIHLPQGSQPVKGEGLMVPTIYDTYLSREPGEEISSTVGVGIPIGQEGCGVGFVYSAACSRSEAENAIHEIIEEGMQQKGYDQYHSETSVTTTVVTEGWTMTVAAAFFCDTHLEGLFPELQAEFTNSTALIATENLD